MELVVSCFVSQGMARKNPPVYYAQPVGNSPRLAESGTDGDIGIFAVEQSGQNRKRLRLNSSRNSLILLARLAEFEPATPQLGKPKTFYTERWCLLDNPMAGSILLFFRFGNHKWPETRRPPGKQEEFNKAKKMERCVAKRRGRRAFPCTGIVRYEAHWADLKTSRAQPMLRGALVAKGGILPAHALQPRVAGALPQTSHMNCTGSLRDSNTIFLSVFTGHSSTTLSVLSH